MSVRVREAAFASLRHLCTLHGTPKPGQRRRKGCIAGQLAGAPAALALFMWLSYRCVVATGLESIPLFGECGLANQLGSIEYSRPRRFCQKLEQWLKMIRLLWPACPAQISRDGTALLVNRGSAV